MAGSPLEDGRWKLERLELLPCRQELENPNRVGQGIGLASCAYDLTDLLQTSQRGLLSPHARVPSDLSLRCGSRESPRQASQPVSSFVRADVLDEGIYREQEGGSHDTAAERTAVFG